MLYEIKIKRPSEIEDKEIKEHYVLDAETHGEAETKGYEIGGNGTDVFAVYRSGIKEIVNDKVDSMPFFQAVVVERFHLDNGKEKDMKYNMLVCAEDLNAATDYMVEYLQQGYDNMHLDSIKKTKITNYIPY